MQNASPSWRQEFNCVQFSPMYCTHGYDTYPWYCTKKCDSLYGTVRYLKTTRVLHCATVRLDYSILHAVARHSRFVSKYASRATERSAQTALIKKYCPFARFTSNTTAQSHPLRRILFCTLVRYSTQQISEGRRCIVDTA